MNKDSEETLDTVLEELLGGKENSKKEVGVQVDDKEGTVEVLDKSNIVKTEQIIDLNSAEGYEYSQTFDKEKYLKHIKAKELLDKTITPTKLNVNKRGGTRTDPSVVHVQLIDTKRPKKIKDMADMMDVDKAAAMIPICIGARNVSEFINTCDIAVKSVDKASLPLLIKIINSKLGGNALEATKYRSTDSWEDIKSILKGAFEHKASKRTLTIGLNFARMRDDEDVTSFAGRVEELYYKLCVAGSEKLSEDEAKVYKRQLKNQALIIFVNGLPKHLNLALKARNPQTLESAMQIAKDEETEHNANLQMDKLQKGLEKQDITKEGGNDVLGNNVRQPTNNRNRNNTQYHVDYDRGNNGYNIPNNKYNEFRRKNNNKNSYINYNHDGYNNFERQNNNNNQCGINNQSMAVNNTGCYNCGNRNHFARDCRQSNQGRN